MITLGLEEGTLVVQVEDDGRAMTGSGSPPPDWPHYGLHTMQERAATIGAELRFDPEIHRARASCCTSRR